MRATIILLILGSLPEMSTSANLKSGDSLFCPTPYSQPPNVNGPPPPLINQRSPPLEWRRTLYEVLHEVHTFQFAINILISKQKNLC